MVVQLIAGFSVFVTLAGVTYLFLDRQKNKPQIKEATSQQPVADLLLEQHQLSETECEQMRQIAAAAGLKSIVPLFLDPQWLDTAGAVDLKARLFPRADSGFSDAESVAKSA